MILKVKDLRKFYGEKAAVDGISFEVEKERSLPYSVQTVPVKQRL